MKKIVLLVFSLVLLSGAVWAQKAVRYPVPVQPLKENKSTFKIHIMPTLPASVTNDDPLTPYTEKIKVAKGKINEWFFIHIAFPVLAPEKNDQWDKWVDDLKVMVEVCIPGRNRKGDIKYVVLQGAQTLNPVQADGKQHHVRFFIPPYAIFRYMVDETGTSSDSYKKLAQEIPVLVTVFWKGMPISYIARETKSGKTADRASLLKMFEQLRDMRSSYYENVILPAEFTPWSCRDLERFESMKFDFSGGK